MLGDVQGNRLLFVNQLGLLVVPLASCANFREVVPNLFSELGEEGDDYEKSNADDHCCGRCLHQDRRGCFVVDTYPVVSEESAGPKHDDCDDCDNADEEILHLFFGVLEEGTHGQFLSERAFGKMVSVSGEKYRPLENIVKPACYIQKNHQFERFFCVSPSVVLRNSALFTLSKF